MNKAQEMTTDHRDRVIQTSRLYDHGVFVSVLAHLKPRSSAAYRY